ncbi:hypothetical protein Tco_1222836, partial [Tanacetum coccineum]
EPKGSNDYTEVTYEKEQCLGDHYTALVTPPAYTPSIPFLATMEPADTLLMGMIIPLPTTDVKEEDFDINSPLGEQVVDFLMENEDVVGLPRHLVKRLFSHLLKNPSLTKGMSDEPLGDDSKSISYDVTFSNPLFDFNDDFTNRNDNPLFDEEFEDISSLDPPESTPVIDESSFLVTPLPDPEQICLREVERFDPFFSLTQSDGNTRVMETPSFGSHHMPSPRLAAYSPKSVMYCYYHPHLITGDGSDLKTKSKTPYDLEDLRACFQSFNHAVSDYFYDYILGILNPDHMYI